jgi:transcriptional regulator with AAA-type ATPase domain
MRSIGLNNYIQYRMYFSQKKDQLSKRQMQSLIDRLEGLRELVDQQSEIENLDDLILDIEDRMEAPIPKRPRGNEPLKTTNVKVCELKIVIPNWNEGDISKKVEREILRLALQQTNGNKTQAARLLGVTYVTVKNRIKQFDLQATEE